MNTSVCEGAHQMGAVEVWRGPAASWREAGKEEVGDPVALV